MVKCLQFGGARGESVVFVVCFVLVGFLFVWLVFWFGFVGIFLFALGVSWLVGWFHFIF